MVDGRAGSLPSPHTCRLPHNRETPPPGKWSAGALVPFAEPPMLPGGSDEPVDRYDWLVPTATTRKPIPAAGRALAADSRADELPSHNGQAQSIQAIAETCLVGTQR